VSQQNRQKRLCVVAEDSTRHSKINPPLAMSTIDPAIMLQRYIRPGFVVWEYIASTQEASIDFGCY
jgi:hypothetical protein